MRNLRVNFGEFLGRRGAALVLAGTMLVGLTGCGEKAECDVKEDHAHLYISENNFSRYLEKEYLEYEGYTRTEDYIVIDSEDSKLIKFEDKHDLLKIDENMQAIENLEESNHDFIEYRYAYTYMMPIPHYTRVGKMTTMYYTYIPTTHYSWTSDPNHSRLTGEQRRCHHVYQACNVMVDEKGKYVIIPSEYVDSISELNGEYTYIKKGFCKVVDAEYGYDLDYEDGVEDDPDLVEDSEDANAANQSYTTGDETAKKLIKK